MLVTDIRIKLAPEVPPVVAYASVVFDGAFAVHDLKVVAVGGKVPFVAMPSKQLKDHCPRCQARNPVRQRHCGHCGVSLGRGPNLSLGRESHCDIAHPIAGKFRAQLTEAVLCSYRLELERSKRPGYVSRHGDFQEESA